MITDFEETEIGTSPVNADTDGDSLDDLTEINANFDPLNTNPDGDSFSDAAEYARDSDPLYYDLTGWEYAAAVVAGFTLGDAGQNMVDLGWLNPAYLQSFGYIGGWLASGFVGLGDVRDTLATLVRGDIADTFLNAMGLIPFLGDGTKVVRVIGKYLEWLPKNMGAIGRWLFKQFSDAQQLRMSALPILGYTDEIAALIARSDADELVARGNNLNEIQELVKRHPNKLNLSTKAVDFINWNNVDAAVRLYWPKAQGNLYAQARSTEAAVEYLNTLGYNTLFVGSRRANYPTGLRIGPDIVAENPVTGKVVVIEVKGNVDAGREVINKSRMQSEVRGQTLTENTFDWLDTNPQRYLTALQGAADPQIRQAGDLLDSIVNGTATYEVVVIGSGRQPSRWGRRLDGVFEALVDRTTSVEFVKLPWP